MAYTTINKPSDYFNTVLYTGNGTDAHAITGVGFQPDLVWGKSRNDIRNHWIQNSVSGATNYMYVNATDAEATSSLTLQSFDSDGFTLGTAFTWNLTQMVILLLAYQQTQQQALVLFHLLVMVVLINK